MHLSGWSVGVSGTSLLALPSTAALRTPFRLVGVTLGCEEFLLASSKGEFVPTIHAGKGLVWKHPLDDLLRFYSAIVGYQVLKIPISKNLLPVFDAGPGVALPGNSNDGLRVSLIKHLTVASNFCVSGLLRRANLSGSTSTFLEVFSILLLRSCSI
jgi:hypothetical protein